VSLPTDAKQRKAIPIARGVLDYFPDAIAAVAEVSRVGNDQHNPGQPMHWAREKSTDHADCIARHLIERGTLDPMDSLRHSAKLAWRALALLQLELEEAHRAQEGPDGAGLPARNPTPGPDPFWEQFKKDVKRDWEKARIKRETIPGEVLVHA
jgi:hypothetical protein